VTRGLYSLDKKTGKAFSLFNPGAGLMMLPATTAGRLLNRWTGRHHPDPFDLYYQRLAGFTAVIISALTILVLSLILYKFYSFGVAVYLPLLFLLGTNWLFYSTAFAAWSHVYALFLFVCLIWSFVHFLEKKKPLAALFFGLTGGLSLAARNSSILIFLLLFLFSVRCLLKTPKAVRFRRAIVLLVLVGLFFLVGAAPQLMVNEIAHGSPFRTSWTAASSVQEEFGPTGKKDLRALDPANLQFLYTNLTNSDNGLFYYHPFYLIGLLGLLFLRHRDPLLQSLVDLLLVGVFLFWFIDAAYFDNWFNRAAGAGYGHRRYIDLLPVFVIGAANILEWSRNRKVARYLVFLLYSALTAGGSVLFYKFLTHDRIFYAVRDSFIGLYRYLIVNGPALLVLAAVFLIFPGLVKPQKKVGKLALRSPTAILIFAVLFVLPAFAFRSSPARDRQRFHAKRGFFLMYSPTPLVRLPGHCWGPPENAARPMLFSSAIIELPAPVAKDDILQFKLTPLFRQGEAGGIMTVYLGQQAIGRAALRKGTQVCQFRVSPSLPDQRLVTIRFENKKARSPAALFHEGRLVFREWDEPPFGNVDLPPNRYVLGSQGLTVEGWALDDRGVRQVIIKRQPFTEETTSRLDDDGLITLGIAEFRTGTRPDVGRVFVLYPAIERPGWAFHLDRRFLPRCEDGSLFIHVLAIDDQGQRTEIGKKEISFNN
jgi:hypothetical protein